MTDIDRMNKAMDESRTSGDMTQAEFEAAFNNQNTNLKDDGNPYILPQYAMMGGGADMGSEDVEEKTHDA